MMDIFSFGEQLLKINDLDPVYVLLWNVKFEPTKLKRWLLAYWCFYHMGTSSWIAHTENGYWERFMTAAQSKEYPRCPERRHFRGDNAIKSTTYLKSRGIESLFVPLLRTREQTAEEAMKEVKQWVGFGPWISFKVIDMLERLGLSRITFDTETIFLFDSPKEGAERLYTEFRKPVINTSIEAWAVEKILSKLGKRKAPPRYEREINGQEAETILCKWKSHTNGKYTVGEDVHSCRKSLLKFATCRTSQDLLKAGKGKLW